MPSIFLAIIQNYILTLSVINGRLRLIQQAFGWNCMTRFLIHPDTLQLPARPVQKKIRPLQNGKQINYFPDIPISHCTPHEGLTIGIVFPKDFLQQQNYRMRGSYWLILPFMVFTIMFIYLEKMGQRR